MAESVRTFGRNTSALDSLDVKADAVSSPPSGNSSDTLHDSECFEEEIKFISTSPLSTATLNFEELSIRDEDLSSHPSKHTDRLTGTFFNPGQDPTPTPAPAPAPTYGRHSQFRRYNDRFHQGPVFVRGGSSHRNTRAWVSEETRIAQEFLTIRNSMRRVFKNADVAKWKVSDYIAHREAMMASATKKLAQQAQDREEGVNLYSLPIPPKTQDMMRLCGLSGNFEQIGNYSRALGEKTIWCADWQSGKDEISPWPCLAEMKWEGDDRAKTGVGRYPPLPREQGPIGLPWNQLQAVDQYPLDQIARIPTMEDVYLPVDEIDDSVKYDLLNKDLEDAMDVYLES
ncbi:hypothetical protein C7974DRAFT_441521 [Boeremia exigua]|uniref:uncharacterized protein n=1 Tax=Boeremia exigua TaxID=749465 RepID=UPI001E8DAAA9|nr:uncharacterized protein C7974DRAFT_441521 [Boeremia exigua]KAH6618931.1 hypothetical protein C7974DRAFT_441521 [Boeremia exigua]